MLFLGHHCHHCHYCLSFSVLWWVEGTKGLPQCLRGKESAYSAGDLHLIPGSGRSPGGVHGNPLQYSCWRIPWTEDPGVLQCKDSTKSDTTEAAEHRAAQCRQCPKYQAVRLRKSKTPANTFLFGAQISTQSLPISCIFEGCCWVLCRYRCTAKW